MGAAWRAGVTDRLDSDRPAVDALHIGPQKTGSTWLYHCLRSHPQLALPDTDELHFLDFRFHEGAGALERSFADAQAHRIRIDMTTSYFRDGRAPGRARQINPAMRVMFCVRDPVERAFSHYWHEKKKLRFNFRFEECLENYDLFCNWIEPGFYGTHVRAWIEALGQAQILCQEFAQLSRDPQAFLDQALDFLGADIGHTPPVLHRKVNAATGRQTALWRGLNATAYGRMLLRLSKRALPQRLQAFRRESLADADPAVVSELRRIFTPEIEELEEVFSRRFSSLRGA